MNAIIEVTVAESTSGCGNCSCCGPVRHGWAWWIKVNGKTKANSEFFYGANSEQEAREEAARVKEQWERAVAIVNGAEGGEEYEWGGPEFRSEEPDEGSPIICVWSEFQSARDLSPLLVWTNGAVKVIRPLPKGV